MPAKAGGKTGGKGKSAKAKTPKEKGAKKGKRKATRTWSLYIFKVLKQVHSDTGISNKAMNIMNSFINDVFERLASEASMPHCLHCSVPLGLVLAPPPRPLYPPCPSGLVLHPSHGSHSSTYRRETQNMPSSHLHREIPPHVTQFRQMISEDFRWGVRQILASLTKSQLIAPSKKIGPDCRCMLSFSWCVAA